MKHPLRTVLLSGIAALGIAGVASAARTIEQPRYEVVDQADGVELRAYAPHLVAEVTVEAGSLREASSRGFRPLAGYIFGGNQGSDEIAMTAPVTTQAQSSGTKIAMTAPVTTAGQADGTYTVRFSMPTKWTMETLPIPNDSAVRLERIEAEKRAVYRFVGGRSQDRIDEATAKVAAFAAERGLTPLSDIIIAGYDGPRVPLERKRWEVMVIVE